MIPNKSVSQHAFSLVPKIDKPRSVFNRQRSYSTSLDADWLVPVFHSEILPGDTVVLKHSFIVRLLSPALRPFMDNVVLKYYYFYVTYRSVWSNFERFLGAQDNPASSISYVIPQCTAPNVASGGIAIGSLHDYLGLPTGPLSGGGGTTGITFNNLIPRCYQKIWNEWFRSQDTQNSLTVDLGDGPDTYANYTLQKTTKQADYFTSSLPWLQKGGGTGVTLSLGTNATVRTNTTPFITGAQVALQMRNSSTGALPPAAKSLNVDASGNVNWNDTAPGANQTNTYPSNLYADLSTATASTINTLRQSIALQQFLENDARSGTRMQEILKSRWGVTSPDARLQRAEICNLGSMDIRLNPVATTSSFTGEESAASLYAFGTGSDISNGIYKSFVEHGVLMCLISIKLAQPRYAQGLDRHWSYRTRYDMYNPEFANLGEQSILNKEIYANVPDGTSSTQKDGVFGYIPRYDEYRYSRSMVTGLMRPDAAGALGQWSLVEQFTSLPVLGSTFLTSNTPLDRVIATPSQPHFLFDGYWKEQWTRVMPMFSVPGLERL